MPSPGLDITDADSCRRYFGTLDEIVHRFHDLAAEMSSAPLSGMLAGLETTAVRDHLIRLANTLTALSIKHRLTGSAAHKRAQRLTIDRTDSGYPLFQEVVQMTADVADADHHLADLPERDAIKADMIDHVVESRSMPRDLQVTMCRRLYFEMLAAAPLFLAQTPPQLAAIGDEDAEVRPYFVDWSVYDTQRNLPNLYFMALEETGDRPLVHHDRRWRQVAEHLLAQSLSSLKLLTIARGFDKDFPDIHPKYLRRVHLGPIYSNRFTRHTDVVQDLLAEGDSEPGQDWIFCWTVETLRSKHAQETSTGLFGRVQSEIYDIDPHAPEELEAGASAVERCMILPYRPYQRLVDRDVPQLRGVRKFVVGPDDMVLRQA